MKFLVTDECQRLARWLRLCGYDTTSMSTRPLSQLYQAAFNEGRVIVTRNRSVKPGQLIRSIRLGDQQLEEQLRQLVRERALAIDATHMFTRCDVCNVALECVERSRVKSDVPPYVFQTQQTFHRCPSCERIYWAATHWDRARTLLTRVSQEAGDA